MKLYLPAYDNGMGWEDHSVYYSKNIYTSYQEAEKEILSRDMKIDEDRRGNGDTLYKGDMEKAKQSHEEYYANHPEEEYEEFYDYYCLYERAYIVTLNLTENFNSAQFPEDGEWYI